MQNRFFVMAGLVAFGFVVVAGAGNMQRIGHTTLVPRHSNPDDKGMYTAFIDPTNGYAYFIGYYLFKLDITGNLPVQIGPALNIGQFIESAIDSAAGFGYLPRGGSPGIIYRYALGTGTNAVSSAGSLTMSAGSPASIVVDDSDPNPANHYGYVVCTFPGSPARVVKVALSTFTELGFATLSAGETNFLFGSLVDPQKGYAYFVTAPGSSSTSSPAVVKVKLAPGTNAPVRIGAVTLDTVASFIDGASIDTVHGFAYYGTYDSDTNNPSKIYKVKLENGDAPPTLVGHISLKPGEGRLSASVLDPVNGFVYFANDNTYPGGIYQLSLNGTNLPVEIAYLELQGTTNAHPPNGTTAANVTTNSDGVLPFGEVFFRSGVFDPLRGYAYFGQDSRPNQVVKVKLAQVDPFTLTGAKRLPNGSFQFAFTNIAGAAFNALATTNLALHLTNWSALGSSTEVAPGQFQFIDAQATNSASRFYRVRSP